MLLKNTKNMSDQLWKSYLMLWDKLKGKRLFLFYVLHYTVLFLLLSCFVFSDFREAGKSFIWIEDGMPLWFTNMVYLSQTVRDGIQSLLAGEGWTIPLYDFRFGTAPLTWQINPIDLLAVLCPWNKIDTLYDALVILRYYLVGLSFSLFGFYSSQKPISILIGSISYVFCGFSLYAGVRHPNFMFPMLYLPLLIIGTEINLKKGKPYLFIAMIFTALITSVYFFCMTSIFVILYVLVRFPAVYTTNRWREFCKIIGRFVVSGSVGIGLSGFIAIPSLLQILGSGRVGRNMTAYISSWLNFDQSFYDLFLVDFILVPKNIGSWTILGFSVLTIPAIILMFIHRQREDRCLRILFLILTGMILSPVVSYVMSGFNTLSSRWCFIYAFVVSTVLMVQIQQFSKVEKRSLIFIGIGTLLYFVGCYFIADHSRYNEKPIVFLFVALLLLLLFWALGEGSQKMMPLICLIITCFSVCYSGFLIYDSSQGNYISEFTTKDTPYRNYEVSQYGSFAKSEAIKSDAFFYRMAGNNITLESLRTSFYFGVNGITGYSSYQYPSYLQWIRELELSREYDMHKIGGLESRSRMLSLAAVKYYVLREIGTEVSPYGFQEIEQVENRGNHEIIMENQFALPLGYTYDSYLPNEKYQRLSAIAREEAQIQAVILKELPISSDILEASLSLDAQQIPVHITDMNGLDWKEGSLKVTEENATLTLEFKGLPDTETYLRIVNLNLNNGISTRKWTLKASTGETEARGYFAADAYLYTHGQKTQLLDLGYTEDGYTTCKITFPSKGTFQLEDLEIWCQPMDNYGEQLNALRKESLENVETNWRGLTGTISVSKDKMLCIAVPYDKGWTAYVDGKKVKLYQANTAFMAMELTAGDHVVELRYWTPGLTAGIILSAVSVVCLVAIMIYSRYKTKFLQS